MKSDLDGVDANVEYFGNLEVCKLFELAEEGWNFLTILSKSLKRGPLLNYSILSSSANGFAPYVTRFFADTCRRMLATLLNCS